MYRCSSSTRCAQRNRSPVPVAESRGRTAGTPTRIPPRPVDGGQWHRRPSRAWASQVSYPRSLRHIVERCRRRLMTRVNPSGPVRSDLPEKQNHAFRGFFGATTQFGACSRFTTTDPLHIQTTEGSMNRFHDDDDVCTCGHHACLHWERHPYECEADLCPCPKFELRGMIQRSPYSNRSSVMPARPRPAS